MGVIGLVVGFIVLSCAEKADVLLKVMVNFLQSVCFVDDGKKPPRPSERFGIAILKKDTVEMVDESFHRLFGCNVFLSAPT